MDEMESDSGCPWWACVKEKKWRGTLYEGRCGIGHSGGKHRYYERLYRAVRKTDPLCRNPGGRLHRSARGRLFRPIVGTGRRSVRRPMHSTMALHRTMTIMHGRLVVPMMGARLIMVLHMTVDHGTRVLHQR